MSKRCYSLIQMFWFMIKVVAWLEYMFNFFNQIMREMCLYAWWVLHDQWCLNSLYIQYNNRVFLVIFRGISGEIFQGCSVLDFPCSLKHPIPSDIPAIFLGTPPPPQYSWEPPNFVLIFRGISIFCGNLEFSTMVCSCVLELISAEK